MQAHSNESVTNGAPGLPLHELLDALNTSNDGLSTQQARLRLARSGPNEPRRPKLHSIVTEFLRASANPLVVILVVAGIAAAFLGDVADSAIIGAIVFLSAAINFWQTFRSERAVERLREGIAPTATVRRDGVWKELPRREVVEGDVIQLRAGDLVPADARLVDATDLHVHQAALTGESMPAEKSAMGTALPSIGPDSSALVFLGTSVVSGTATAVVYAAGQNTAFGDVVDRLSARPDETAQCSWRGKK
jgi:Mg2+-importing ATPase